MWGNTDKKIVNATKNDCSFNSYGCSLYRNKARLSVSQIFCYRDKVFFFSSLHGYVANNIDYFAQCQLCKRSRFAISFAQTVRGVTKQLQWRTSNYVILKSWPLSIISPVWRNSNVLRGTKAWFHSWNPILRTVNTAIKASMQDIPVDMIRSFIVQWTA